LVSLFIFVNRVILAELPFAYLPTSTPLHTGEGYGKYLPLTVLSFAELNLIASTTTKQNTNTYEHALHYASEGIITWFLVFGFWFLVFGFWFSVFGFWFLVFGFRFLVFGFGFGFRFRFRVLLSI
jgi:hypothetical protein